MKGFECVLYLLANIIVPKAYDPLFDNTERNTILPIKEIRAIAFVANENAVTALLEELEIMYPKVKKQVGCGVLINQRLNQLLQNQSDNTDKCNLVLATILNQHCDFFEEEAVFEVGIDAIDRSNNPARGTVVAYDEELVWIKSVDTPTTFYIVPFDYMSFICK